MWRCRVVNPGRFRHKKKKKKLSPGSATGVVEMINYGAVGRKGIKFKNYR